MSNNNVFFLGAGFSKAINRSYPTLSELSEAINLRFKRPEQDIHLYNYFQDIPDMIKNDLESLLSYLDC